MINKRSPAVDAYIANAPEYAKPILEKIRELYHTTCPEVTESIKWGHPFFSYEGILGNMPAFKKYVRMSFWNSTAMSDPQKLFTGDEESGVIKLTSVADLPADEILIAYIHESMAVNKAGGPPPRPVAKKDPASLEIPGDFAQSLGTDAVATANFESFNLSKRREYVAWIVGAKQDATRAKRIATAVAQISEGKALNWKYEKR